ncbi:TraB/GumN family protein [Brucella sp. BE17]|uniref:TraB/GumN family protein n=1 Tax=Brucella sp. BE17 TaxID=3142977 RepID=UPI0031BADD44
MKKLFLFLLCAVFAGAPNARADENSSACTTRGVNLLDALQKNDPTTWNTLQKEAAAIPNHRGRIWKIEKDGAPSSYLFGTIHFSDPRVLNLPPAVKSAYQSADKVVIEATDIIDPRTFLNIRIEQPDLLLFTDGSTLKSHLPPERAAEIEQKLTERGFVLDAIGKMKPFVLSSMLMLPQCERERAGNGQKMLDIVLATDAQAEGRPIEGLETTAAQFEAINRLPLDFHIRNFVAMVDYGDQVEDAMETTLQLYLQGETGLIMPALRKLVPDDLPDADYDLFQKVLINDRNHTMAERALPLLEQGNVFIAVGALHLPGKEGVVELLRGKGYRLTPL